MASQQPRVALPVAQPVGRGAAAIAVPVAQPIPQQQQAQKPLPVAAAVPALSASPSNGSATVVASSIVVAPVQPAAAASPVGAPSAAAAAVIPRASPVAHAKSSSSDLMIDARLMLDLPGTRVYALVDGTKTLVEDGKLEVLVSVVDGQEVYLLVLGQMQLALRVHIPSLEMAPRNFVFPTDSVTYGIVLADAITDDVLEVFRILLTEHTSFRTAAAPQPIASLPDRTEKIVTKAQSVAAGLGSGSVVVATGVVKGGQMISEVIAKGGAYLTQRLKPNEKPTQVSDESKARLAKAKVMSGAAVKVSKALVVGAMATTEVMGKQLAAAFKETDVGKRLTPRDDEPRTPNDARIDAAKTVGKATLGAVLHVYQALETAVYGVAASTAAATVTVVKHKYGAEAGAHAEGSLGVAGEVASAGMAVKSLGLKSIAKKTAVKASQDVLKTKAERDAEAAEQARLLAASRGSAASGSNNVNAAIGSALGLPAGVDPLVALEAAQAFGALSAAAAPYVNANASAPSSSNEGVVVTTAVATGPTPEAAHAAALAAAQKQANAK